MELRSQDRKIILALEKEMNRIQGCLYYLMGHLGGGDSGCDEPLYTGKEVAELLRAVCEGVK